jgi:hypothetical protein
MNEIRTWTSRGQTTMQKAFLFALDQSGIGKGKVLHLLD